MATTRQLFEAINAILTATPEQNLGALVQPLVALCEAKEEQQAEANKADEAQENKQAQADKKAEWALFDYHRKMLLGSPQIKSYIGDYKKRLLRPRKDLLIHLRRYRQLVSYSHHDVHHKIGVGELGNAEAAVNRAGIVTGEGTSSVLRLIDYIPVFPQKPLIFLHKLQPILGPISYFLYGIGALLSVPVKLWKAIRMSNDQGPVPLPQAYPLSNFASAMANILVAILYISAGFIFAGSNLAFMGPVGLFLLPWGGFALGTVGTFLGWLGNNVIDRWRAKREYEELSDIQKSFPAVSDHVDTKRKEFIEEDHHAYLGTFMVLGMGLFALASFLPADAYIVPLLPVTVSLPTLIGSACFVYYAKDWILENIFCCPKKEMHIHEAPAPSVPPILAQGNSAEKAVAALPKTAVAPAQADTQTHTSTVAFTGNGNHNPGFGYASQAGSGLGLPNHPTQAPPTQRMD